MWWHTYPDVLCHSEQLKLSRPSADELGYADSVSVEEIGGVRVCLSICSFRRSVCHIFIIFPHNTWFVLLQVTVVKNEEGGNSVATVVLRGSTDSILDDLERAVDDGVNTYKVFLRYIQQMEVTILGFGTFICCYLVNSAHVIVGVCTSQCAGTAGLFLVLRQQKQSWLGD